MKTLQIALVAAMTLVSTVAMAQPGPPPPPQVEVGPFPPPGPPSQYGLEPGHWKWNGFRYVWIPRHWVLRVPGYAHWMPGHVNRFGVWVPGHWVP
jgi:hypothetical protein